jgi:prepilin-type processing-associated H-X9-DG protein
MEPRTSRGIGWWSRLFLGGVTVLGIGFLCILLENPYLFSSPCGKPRQILCPNNLKRLGVGLLLYIQDNDERFPPFHDWNQLINPYIKDRYCFFCPLGGREPDAKYYAAFALLEMRFLEQIEKPAETPAFYDSTSTKPSPYDFLRSLPVPERHNGGNYVAYADGHAKYSRNPEIWRQGDEAIEELLRKIPENPKTPPSKSR